MTNGTWGLSGIYRILNRINSKVYIGQSVNISGRFAAHRCALRGGRHWNQRLQRAWNKYGEHAFSFEPVMIVEDHRCLDSAEEGWFYLTKCLDERYGYNMSSCAAAPTRGLGVSASRRARMRAEMKRRMREQPESMLTFINSGRGVTRSAETKAKMSEAQKKRFAARPMPKETKAKISATKLAHRKMKSRMV